MGRQSEEMERRMDNGEVKKSSEGPTAVAKARAGQGAPMALTAMAKGEEVVLNQDSVLT